MTFCCVPQICELPGLPCAVLASLFVLQGHRVSEPLRDKSCSICFILGPSCSTLCTSICLICPVNVSELLFALPALGGDLSRPVLRLTFLLHHAPELGSFAVGDQRGQRLCVRVELDGVLLTRGRGRARDKHSNGTFLRAVRCGSPVEPVPYVHLERLKGLLLDQRLSTTERSQWFAPTSGHGAWQCNRRRCRAAQ